MARSLKLGHIRLTDRFFPGGVIADGAVKQCRRYVRSFIAPVAAEINDLGFEVAVGCSGTIATVATMIASAGGREVRTVDNAVITRSELDELVDDVIARRTPEDRGTISGLESHRLDVIVAGAVLLRQIFRARDVSEMIVLPNALREGLLLGRVRRTGPTAD